MRKETKPDYLIKRGIKSKDTNLSVRQHYSTELSERMLFMDESYIKTMKEKMPTMTDLRFYDAKTNARPGVSEFEFTSKFSQNFNDYFISKVKTINKELDINDQQPTASKDEKMVQTKPRFIECPVPIVFDRPNKMRVVQNQCLFSLKVRISDLPLRIVASSIKKTTFRFYLGLTSQLPDNDNFERKFETDQIVVTQEMAKEILRDMLKHPSKRQVALACIQRAGLSRPAASRTRPFRDTKSRYTSSMGDTRYTQAEIFNTTQGSMTPRALLTTMPREIESYEEGHGDQCEFEDFELDGAMINLTFRCFSNSPTIMLTATLQKNQPLKRMQRTKNEDFFSTKKVEGLQKALEETRAQRERILTQASFTGAMKLMMIEKQPVKPAESKIKINKRIAKNFLSHRIEHLDKLANQKPLTIQFHMKKARQIRDLMRQEKTDKIEFDNQKRLHLRSAREEREHRQRLIPFQIISISMLRMFTVLGAIKKKFIELKKTRVRHYKLKLCAKKIQASWLFFLNESLPRFPAQRRRLDGQNTAKMVAGLLRHKVVENSKKTVGVFMKLCYQNVKMKVCFYQSSLYAAILQRRYKSYLQNQALNVKLLRDQWQKEYEILVILESREKSITQLSGIGALLGEVEESFKTALLKQLYKAQWLHFIEANYHKMFNGRKNEDICLGGPSPKDKRSRHKLGVSIIDVPVGNLKKTRPKKVVPIGGRRVFDILKEAIIRAPENFILNKIEPLDLWIAKTEEAYAKIRHDSRRLANQSSEERSFTAGRKEDGVVGGSRKDMSRGKTMLLSLENLPEVIESEQTDTPKAKVQQLISSRPEIKKFFEARFDPTKFRVEVSSQQMKSLIMETARFCSSNQGNDLKKALAVARQTINLGPHFLDKFQLANFN